MRITSYTNYSLRLLMYCAAKPDQVFSVKSIAQSFGISEAHLVKAARDLAEQGVLESVRGRHGGVRLAQPPEDIRIGDIVRHAERHCNLAECFTTAPAPSRCPLAGICRFERVLHGAKDAFFRVLDQATLADIPLDSAALD